MKKSIFLVIFFVLINIISLSLGIRGVYAFKYVDREDIYYGLSFKSTDLIGIDITALTKKEYVDQGNFQDKIQVIPYLCLNLPLGESLILSLMGAPIIWYENEKLNFSEEEFYAGVEIYLKLLILNVFARVIIRTNFAFEIDENAIGIEVGGGLNF